MFGKKQNLIIGLTTYYTENLAISISGLSHITERFLLVVYNDNPNVRVTSGQIREYGYMGPLQIINGVENIGLMRARLAILDVARTQKRTPDWIMFIDDDDVLLNADIPNVSGNNFAVIQNMVVLRTRLRDVLRVISNPNDYNVDNENVYLVRPHVGLSGALIRTTAAFRMGEVLRSLTCKFSETNSDLDFLPPTDLMMWSALNIISRHDNELACPIYIDTVNYIVIDLDSATTKYNKLIAPKKNAETQLKQLLSQYDTLVRDALNDAAPAGQE